VLISWGFKLNGGNSGGYGEFAVIPPVRRSDGTSGLRLWLTKIQSRSGGKMAASVELRCYGLSWV